MRIGFLVAGLVDQMSRQCAVHDTQNLSHDSGLAGEQVAQRVGDAEHPLAHRSVG